MDPNRLFYVAEIIFHHLRIIAHTEGKVQAAVSPLAGLTPKMVTYLHDRFHVGPEYLEVALGPAIGPCCYEVQGDVSEPLLAKWGGLAEGCLHKKNGNHFVDLRRLNALLSQEAGVPPEQIFTIGPCTACTLDEFYSYRRDGVPGVKETGRQLSFAGWL